MTPADAERARTHSAARELAADKVATWKRSGDLVVALVAGGVHQFDPTGLLPVRYAFRSPVFDRSVHVAGLFANDTFAVNVGVDRPMRLTEIPTASAWSLAHHHGVRACRAWAREIVDALEVMRSASGRPRLRLVIFAPAPIADALRFVADARAASAPHRWSEPLDVLRGLKIGDRLYVLARASWMLADARKVG